MMISRRMTMTSELLKRSLFVLVALLLVGTFSIGVVAGAESILDGNELRIYHVNDSIKNIPDEVHYLADLYKKK